MYVSYNLLLLRIRGNSLLLGKEFLELAPEHQQKEYEIAHIHDASKNCHIRFPNATSSDLQFIFDCAIHLHSMECFMNL